MERETISAVCRAVPIASVVQMLGLDTKQTGKRLQLICPNPAHNDRRFGSCACPIDHEPEHNTVYCFACGYRANPIDLVMTVKSVNWKTAVTYLSDNFGLGVDFSKSNFSPRPSARIKRSVLESAGIRDIEMLRKALAENRNAAKAYIDQMLSDKISAVKNCLNFSHSEEVYNALRHQLEDYQKSRSILKKNDDFSISN